MKFRYVLVRAIGTFLRGCLGTTRRDVNGSGVPPQDSKRGIAARDTTTRDYRERINRVIFHVEAHLGEPLNLEDLARVASCFEVYLNSPDQVKPEDLRTEIWLPLV